MAGISGRIGIVGGSGMLGRAITKALIDGGVLAAHDLWISNRSGSATGLPDGVTHTTSNQSLADACEMIVLSVPPANIADIDIDIDGHDRLVVSVMAGVTLDRIKEISGTRRVVRAMSSPAAEFGLAFSPWVASADVTAEDRYRVSALFGACGATVELESEDHIACFTAMTGPVPGFVAFFAECMVDYANEQGIAADVADLAIRQLFLAAGRMMAESSATPAEHVQAMIDYAGTTAAGLSAMRASPIRQHIADGLNAAVARTRGMV